MLVLTRNRGERIRIGEDVVVTILRVVKGRVKIGIEAPKNVTVNRDEITRSVNGKKGR